MLRFLFVLPFFIVGNFIVAQNLISDPSFEDYYGCPNQNSQLDSLKHWFTVSETPDYFNICAAGTNVAVPLSQLGLQFPRNGNGYTGLFTNCTPFLNAREIFAQHLNSALNIGQIYFVSFFICYSGQYQSFCSSNNFGIKFFVNNPKLYSFNDIVNNNCQYKVDTFLVDSVNWTHYQFSFVADSNYNYMALGNFYDDNHTSYLILDTIITPTGCCSYFFIDDVCLSTDSNLCYNVGFQNPINFSQDLINVYPNPFSNKLMVSSVKNIDGIDIYDCRSICVTQAFEFEQVSSTKLNVKKMTPITDGLYIIIVKTGGHFISKLISLTN